MGLVEEEWLDTLTTVDRKDLTYVDYVDKGNELCKELRVSFNFKNMHLEII